MRGLSLELRPTVLDDFGLVAALRWYIDRLKQRGSYTIRFMPDSFPERLSPEIENTCFRVAQEALTNIARHSRATHIDIKLRRKKSGLQLTIHDDGIGFDLAVAERRAAHGECLGLISMQERVQLAGGQTVIESNPQQGVTISIKLPLRYPP